MTMNRNDSIPDELKSFDIVMEMRGNNIMYNEMNRKILLVLLQTMMLLTQASAQTTEQEDAVGHFTYCPYLAVFYSLYSASDESTGGNKLQVGFGFETEYRLTKEIGISAGLELANFGVKGNSTLSDRYGPIHTFENEYKMKTLSLPLMFNLHPLASNRLSLRIGLQPGWLIQTSSDKLSSRGMCFAIPIGVAVGVSERVQLELRAQVGTTNFEERQGYSELNQRTLALNLTYVIR